MLIQVDVNSMRDQIEKLGQNLESVGSLVTRSVAESIYREWIRQAALVLNKEYQGYVEGLSINEVSENIYDIGIEDQDSFAAKVEKGTDQFDMKIGFANSAKVKRTKKGGWYLTIPFSIGTPGSNPNNFSKIMPRSVYNAVRSAIRNNEKVQLPPKYDVLSKPHHKGPIFGGITQNSSGYSTFRRVSDKSDPKSWIHPGFKSKNIMQKVVASINIDNIIKETINSL